MQGGSDSLVTGDAQRFHLSNRSRLLVCLGRPREDQDWVEVFAGAAAASGFEVASVRSSRAAAHEWVLQREFALLVVLADLPPAAAVAADSNVPILYAPDRTPDHVMRDLASSWVRAETLIQVEVGGLARTSAMAECTVTPGAGGRGLLVRGPNGLNATMPFLRVVNRDPFGFLDDGFCRLTSGTMIGLCWSASEPFADRMLRRRGRVTVTAPDSGQLEVECDRGRHRVQTDRIVIGPSAGLRVVTSHRP